jgi:hypothetical protein
MAEALKDYFGKVRASDVFDYGYGKRLIFQRPCSTIGLLQIHLFV